MSAIQDISSENPVIENIGNNHSHFSDDESENTQTMNNNNSKKDRVIIMNTVLAYIQYGISSAIPDKVLEVVCTHFTSTEIIEAKDVLWNDCKLGNPPSRNNSKCRKAAEAHVQDIMDYMFKLDVENYVFSVEAGGVVRLPKFNAESLNVVAINQQIVYLKEMCYTNKMVAASYRNDFLSLTTTHECPSRHSSARWQFQY